MAITKVTPSQLSSEWWEEIGRVTLGSAGNTLSLTSLPVRKYLKVLIFATGTATTGEIMRFNNDSGTNYHYNRSISDGANSTAVSQTSIDFFGDTSADTCLEATIMNVLANRKGVQAIRWVTYAGATPPAFVDVSGVWSNTSAAITRIDYITSTSTFAIGSEMIVLGHD